VVSNSNDRTGATLRPHISFTQLPPCVPSSSCYLALSNTAASWQHPPLLSCRGFGARLLEDRPPRGRSDLGDPRSNGINEIIHLPSLPMRFGHRFRKSAQASDLNGPAGAETRLARQKALLQSFAGSVRRLPYHLGSFLFHSDRQAPARGTDRLSPSSPSKPECSAPHLPSEGHH